MNEAKEKDKIVKFKLTRGALLDMFAEAYDGGDLFGALSVLNKAGEKFGRDEELYADLIDVYDDLGAYSRSLNTWFEYIDRYGIRRNAGEKYEGLAVSYANIGMEAESIYYYKKMIEASTPTELVEQFGDVELEALSSTINDSTRNLRLVYSRAHADYSQAINESMEHLRRGEFSEAVDKLALVECGSEDYVSAKNLIAVCYAMTGRPALGRITCEELLKSYPDDVQTKTTLAAMCIEQGDKEESRRIALELCKMENVSEENLYKIATVACENGLEEEALKIFSRLEKDSPGDKNLLYFLAAINFNLKRYGVSRRYFRKIITLEPDAFVAEYYGALAAEYEERQRYNSSIPTDEIPYVYHLPEEERKARIKFLNAYLKKSAHEENDARYMDECLKWALDEYNGQDGELVLLALKAAAKRLDMEFINGMLMRYDLSDSIKLTALYMIVMNNVDCYINVVISNILFRFEFDAIKLGRRGKKLFLSAAADIISRYSLIDKKNMKKIKCAAERIYSEAYAPHPELKADVQSIKCAIYLLAGLSGGEAWGESVRNFNADAYTVIRLLNVEDNIIAGLFASSADKANNTEKKKKAKSGGAADKKE